MTPLHSLTPKMWELIYYMPSLLHYEASYYEFQHHLGFFAVENFAQGRQSLGIHNG